MTTNPWEDFAKRSRELYEQQAELAHLARWADQAREHLGWRWPGWHGSRCRGHGRAVALLAGGRQLAGQRRARLTGATGQVASETLGRLLDPLSLALVGGSQVGETIRRMTEGPRLADLGPSSGAWPRSWSSGCPCSRRHVATRLLSPVLGPRPTGACDRVPGALPCWPGTRPAESSARAVAGCRQPDPARDASVGVVPESTRRALAPWHEFPLAEREMVEALVEPAGLPTRTEIDEVHRSVQELKRRVRA